MLRIPRYLILSSTVLFGACALFDDSATKKPSNNGLIATPVSYYSTSRARSLGTKYKDHLDRLVERIVRNSKTANLQFANNISSVGGIGFFTHSATKTADERYLEVVLAAPETFETRGAHNDKINRLFSAYGLDLLTILGGENDIYQDKELTGYGINIAWRNVLSEPAGNRVTLERAIVYLNKEKARGYLKREITQNDLLADATIFTVEEDGPLNLVSYRPPEVRPEFRPAIREDDLPALATAIPDPAVPPAITPGGIRSENLPLKEPVAKNAPPKPPVAVTQKPKPAAPNPSATAATSPRPAPSAAAIKPPVETQIVETAPAESLKSAVTPPVNEVKTATAPAQPITKTVEPKRAAVEAPKAVMKTPVPTIVAPAAVEATEPAVVAAPPRGESAPSAPISAQTLESAAAKPPPVQIKPFLPPPAATSRAPLPEAPKMEKIAPPVASAPPETKLSEVTRVAPVVAQPAPPLFPVEAPVLAAPPAQTAVKSAPPVIEAPAPSVAVGQPRQTPKVEAKPVEIVSAPPAAAPLAPASPSVEPMRAVPAMPIAPRAPTVIEAPARPVVAPSPPPVVKAEIQPVEIIQPPPVSVQPAPSPPVAELPATLPVQPIAKSAPPAVEATASPVVAARPPAVEKAQAKPAGEQLALLPTKPIESTPVKPAIPRSAPRPLEGFIIQLSFNDKERAQRWAEAMEKKGFAVSVTEAGAEGALRVRLGNFVVRDDAERQLRTIKQEGLNGIILNLPQAFRPEARTSIP